MVVHPYADHTLVPGAGTFNDQQLPTCTPLLGRAFDQHRDNYTWKVSSALLLVLNSGVNTKFICTSLSAECLLLDLSAHWADPSRVSNTAGAAQQQFNSHFYYKRNVVFLSKDSDRVTRMPCQRIILA